MSLQTELNRADPNPLPDLLRAAAIGNVLKQLAGQAAIEENVAVNANVGVLQNRALSILAVTPTAGAAAGPVTLVSASVAPVTKTASIGLAQKTLPALARAVLYHGVSTVDQNPQLARRELRAAARRRRLGSDALRARGIVSRWLVEQSVR
jgi:hypothetical protein